MFLSHTETGFLLKKIVHVKSSILAILQLNSFQYLPDPQGYHQKILHLDFLIW